ITEATRINEMAMIFGLCLLTVGNFLGAIWANESWGRYWSWDSKETWALVSILVYAAILHLRMIPKYCNQFVFALWSMFAYWVIIMTYFGVNYFLTGLHSYAAGEAAQIPNYVYWGFALMVVLAFFARRKRNFVGKL
ncbi:cytochrome c biogenesis protein CcsA, partial [Campylobacter coli]|nr:cytochrome c biogenesis protein CcsA [Campylobacter coli]